MKPLFSVVFITLLLFRLIPIIFPPFDGSIVRITGSVSNQPVSVYKHQWLRIGVINVKVESKENINYGDQVTVQGRVENREIKEAILLQHYKAQSIFTEFHNRFVGIIASALPSKDAALVAGIVLGDKKLISSERYDQFKATGVAHVVVASGMNVTLVAGAVLAIFLKIVDRRKAVIFSIVTIWIYVLMAGVFAPLVRAGIMGTIAFSAQWLGRLNSTIIRALLISLYLMLFIYPWWIIDLGLWLSFAATLSLILFEAKVSRYVSKIPTIFREGLSTSLAAQVLVTPILLVNFGTISLVGPIVNAFVLWTVTPLMIIGLFGTMAGLINTTVGTLIFYLVLPLTTWFYFIIDLFS